MSDAKGVSDGVRDKRDELSYRIVRNPAVQRLLHATITPAISTYLLVGRSFRSTVNEQMRGKTQKNGVCKKPQASLSLGFSQTRGSALVAADGWTDGLI